MKKLYTTQDRIILYILKDKLDELGLSTLIKNEDPAGQAAGRLPPVIAWPELWIMDDTQYAAAEKMIQTELVRLNQPQQLWRCPDCGEELEGQFDVCWKCGTSKH